MRFPRLALIAFALIAAAMPAHAQDDEEGSKDHPMFSRMPGYFIGDYDAQDFGSFDFDVGQGSDTKHVEGKYWRIGYQIKEGQKKAGPLQIGRNYTALMVARGGKKLWEELSSSGGGTTASMPANTHTIWLQVDVSNNGDNYDLIVVEEAAMKQDVEFSAAELAEALRTKGSAALHNILFETGKSAITPESAGALGVIGDVLKADPSLKLEIQGHTDNVGAAAANLKLSQDRAAAVKAYVVQTFGVAADRLTTAGFGDTKPVADNSTDEGRAANRRVELVKK
jgi:outer membrane protein OmpA-like peptidoglycan-associated protein